MFEMMEVPTRKWWTVPFAMMGELSIVTLLVLIPILHVEMPTSLVTKLVLLAPAPPPPPPPAGATVAHAAQKVVARKFDITKLPSPVLSPKINKEIAMELPDAPEIAGGVMGGVPGGVPGGVVGGVLGGTLGGLVHGLPGIAPPPPAPAPASAVAAATPPATPSRINVGGNVQSAMLLHQVTPAYPPLAKTWRIAGTVKMKAVIGTDGRVKDLAVVSGPALLVKAVEEAVRQWVYKPTLLNGQAVEVETEISVNFSFLAT